MRLKCLTELTRESVEGVEDSPIDGDLLPHVQQETNFGHNTPYVLSLIPEWTQVSTIPNVFVKTVPSVYV